ncbi:CmpA/NrtA family ABC transporter substrate-binding protein [Aureimonas psammosilenae]|uniref:CmpA/NrtA family ABC transporter substrate-binding protein n=1 Tax=Aureimonas psammosilenae TaxID=2495496 RepID=UPI001F3D3462|nr:CmpA/NrtA family ABC transporter substrate-binding protein [Aureimonas psammosilenae]
MNDDQTFEATRVVRAGFIPLLDAAVLIAAAAKGFDREEGLALDLVREVSWSNIRDRLAFRQFDVAHMLGPMAIASQLGLGSNPYPVIAPFALGQGGNAVTLSVPLFAAMRDAAGADFRDEPKAHARALKRVVERRRVAGSPPLVFGVTYPFSSHNYEFRFWMAEGGIDPDRDVTMTVVPPPFTTDALKAGAIDGFCVNAPWNVLAVEAGIGRIVAVKADIAPSSPEKVLGVRPDWWAENEDTGHRLVRALHRAAHWCAECANHAELAAILAKPAHVGGSAETILAVLSGRLAVDPDGTVRDIPNYLRFHGEGVNRPASAEARWVFGQMARWGQVPLDETSAHRAGLAFRPDLFDRALGRADAGIAGEETSFDPRRIATDLEAFAIRHPMGQGRPDEGLE